MVDSPDTPVVSSTPTHGGLYREVTLPFSMTWRGASTLGYPVQRLYRVHVPEGMQGRTSGLHGVVLLVTAIAWTMPPPWNVALVALAFLGAMHFRYVLEAGSFAHDALYLWWSYVNAWLPKDDPRYKIASRIKVEILDEQGNWKEISWIARSEADRVLLHDRRDPAIFRLWAYVLVTLIGVPTWNDWFARLKRRMCGS